MARDNIKSYQSKFLSEETEKMLNSGHCYYCGCETQRRGMLLYTHVIWGKGIVTGTQKIADHTTFEVPILECPSCSRVKSIRSRIAFSYFALLVGVVFILRYCTHLYSEDYPIAFWVWSVIGFIIFFGCTVGVVEKYLTKFIVRNNSSLRERQSVVSTKDAQHPEIIKKIRNYEENFRRYNPWQKVGEFLDNNR